MDRPLTVVSTARDFNLISTGLVDEMTKESDWDEDIACLDLTDQEKNGLQVYRNYIAAFRREQISRFCSEVDQEEHDLSNLEKVSEAMVTDTTRLVPVIACAFVDDVLDEMFKREIPQGVPGGRDTLFHGYGPLSSLSKRIQIAFSFGWTSPDLLKDIDSIRKVRNRLSHVWDHTSLVAYVSEPPISEITPVEGFFSEHEQRLLLSGVEVLDDFERFRIRLLWIVGRIYYESLFYPRALKQGLDPLDALYGAKHPRLLSMVAENCSRFSRRVLGNEI